MNIVHIILLKRLTGHMIYPRWSHDLLLKGLTGHMIYPRWSHDLLLKELTGHMIYPRWSHDLLFKGLTGHMIYMYTREPTLIFEHCSILSDWGMVLVTTTASMSDLLIRSMAGPEKIPWTHIPYTLVAPASFSLWVCGCVDGWIGGCVCVDGCVSVDGWMGGGEMYNTAESRLQVVTA